MTTRPLPDPGSTERTSYMDVLERALRVVEADVRATGLDGPVDLILYDWGGPAPNIYAVYCGGGSGSTVGVDSEWALDPVQALVALADDLQNSIMHIHWGTVWPVCPAHNLGAHARKHAEAAVWWCNYVGGHVIAAIGQWPS